MLLCVGNLHAGNSVNQRIGYTIGWATCMEFLKLRGSDKIVTMMNSKIAQML